jgi:DNA-binding XRE family transcriptional regulator
MNQMTNKEFKVWRKFMGWSQAAAGNVLGVSTEAIKSYERGFWSDKRPAAPTVTISRLCYLLKRDKEIRDEIEAIAKGR